MYVFHSSEQKACHKACQRPRKQGHSQQHRQIPQHCRAAQYDHGGADLPDIMGRRSGDGHTVNGQPPHPAQSYHHKHSSYAAHKGKQ